MDANFSADLTEEQQREKSVSLRSDFVLELRAGLRSDVSVGHPFDAANQIVHDSLEMRFVRALAGRAAICQQCQPDHRRTANVICLANVGSVPAFSSLSSLEPFKSFANGFDGCFGELGQRTGFVLVLVF